ncbi:isoprenylcysteine carboxylmethyltransferase family protein [Lutibacter sp.]|uniref:methyltransferase family protein n=1 Tax=Lutibacter sp. TaxID=1925666 RepID=UPI0025BBAAFB|nr:isoprenylcysteine carboxylmethyltransferase family protein [Lutibacter sp.]MCF6181646.1 isoprenylcysteine carboxylmethyltransferase family protein [Lutibacter sp.]
MSLIFIIIYTVWFLSEVILSLLLRSKNKGSKNKDNGTLKILWVLILIAIFLAIFVSHFNFPITKNTAIYYVGLLFICTGVIFRFAVIAYLGKFFTVDVTIKENHKLKTDGFYKYVRHPSYAASLLSFIGFGLSYNNWVSLLILVVIISTAFLIRIKTEEKVLINYFGKEYLNYKKSTKKLIPFIY